MIVAMVLGISSLCLGGCVDEGASYTVYSGPSYGGGFYYGHPSYRGSRYRDLHRHRDNDSHRRNDGHYRNDGHRPGNYRPHGPGGDRSHYRGNHDRVIVPNP